MSAGSKSHGGALPGIAWMVLACFLWAVVEEVGHMVPRGHSALQVVWFRYATHLTAMLLIWVPRRGGSFLRTGRPVTQAVRSLLMLVMPLCFIGAVSRIDKGTAWSLFWVSPLAVIAVAQVTLRERVDAVSWGAAATGMAGAVLLLAPQGIPRTALGLLLPLGMAASFGAYQLITRRFREETTEANLFYTAFYVWLALTVFLPVFWSPMSWAAAKPMIAIGVIGLAALLALDRALHLAPASVVAPLGYTQLIWSHVVLGGGPGRSGSLATIAGAALILGSAGVTAVRGGAR